MSCTKPPINLNLFDDDPNNDHAMSLIARLWLPECYKAAESAGMTLEQWGAAMDRLIETGEVIGAKAA